MCKLQYYIDFTKNPKEKSRKATSFILFVLFFSYAYIFFDVVIQENGIASSAILIVIFFLIKSAIEDFDPLYSGNPQKNKYTKAFQKQLPTKYIMEAYKVDKKEAKTLWFNVFNKWADEKHKNHYNWKTSLYRGFKCRMVYFIIFSFRFMFFISLITTIVIGCVNYFQIKFNIEAVDKYFINHSKYGIEIIFTVLCFFIFILFLLINYPNIYNPKGCFLRFNEINEMNIGWLKENLSSKEDFINYGK